MRGYGKAIPPRASVQLSRSTQGTAVCVYRDGDGYFCTGLGFFFVLRSWISPEKRGFWETATTIIFRVFLLLFLDLTLTFLD